MEAAGYTVAALCEIEPSARAVLREHWPHTPLLGDVSLVDGTQWRDVDVIVGGSPCQDLSVAGKRGGLTDGSGTRSSLFHQQARVWHETGAPYLIWENVYGALSSSGGADFAAVLSALVGSAVAVPRDGWKRGGVAAGRNAVAAWRVLDLQHFGVPQRRERVVVLASRVGGVDPAEVLALGQGVRGDSPPRYEARERAAGLAQGRTPEGFWGGGLANCLTAREAKGPNPARDLGTTVIQVIADTLTEATMRAGGATAGKNPGLVNGIIQPIAHTLRGEGCDASEDGTGRGTPMVVAPFNEVQLTNPTNRQSVRAGANAPTLDDSGRMGVIAPCLRVGGRAQGAGDSHDNTPIVADGLGVRMLTPRECERIMGWPDDWTRWGVKESGVRYELKDTPRYKLCGNGIGREWMEWISLRLRAAVESATSECAA
jgi:DNA (cytosine-5)-methyltransferase 1